MPWSLPWAYPEHSREEFNSAAREIVPFYVVGDNPYYAVGVDFPTEKLAHLLSLIDNWRSSHSYPLNIFQAGLRTRAKQVDERAIVAQRLKRFPSIVAKLKRFPEMKLTQIQDIAGCRAIVSSVPQAYRLVQAYKASDIKHKLVHEDDYIRSPKDSGYCCEWWTSLCAITPGHVRLRSTEPSSFCGQTRALKWHLVATAQASASSAMAWFRSAMICIARRISSREQTTDPARR